jgi:hypothetical protein
MLNPFYRAERCRDLAQECCAIAALCITARWLRPRSWVLWRTGRSRFDNSDLTDGVSRTPRTVRPKDPRAVATRTPLSAPPWGQLSLNP